MKGKENKYTKKGGEKGNNYRKRGGEEKQKIGGKEKWKQDNRTVILEK